MKFENEEIETIIIRAKDGIKIADIAKEFFSNEKTIRNALYKYGYKYNKRLNLWLNEELDKESIYIMNNCDIEEEIEMLSKERYYDRYANLYPDGIESEEKVEMVIYKGIYKEIEALAYDYGADFLEELIELILLRFLEQNRKKNLSTNFRRKYFGENGYDEKEIKILMKYNDYDNVPTGADELFWEDDSQPEAKELKEFYIKELEKNNVDLFDMDEKVNVNSSNDEFVNEFNYLKDKYDKLKDSLKD